VSPADAVNTLRDLKHLTSADTTRAAPAPSTVVATKEGAVKTLIKVVQDIGLLVARLVLGLVLVGHGWQRFSHGMAAAVDTLTRYGLPEPQLFAWGATVLDVIGGALLIFGLLTPVVAAFVVAEQVMVIAWLKWQNGLWNAADGIEYSVALAALALILVVFGAGRTGVDQLFRRGKKPAKASSGYDARPA
jgi:putative oxidoreductase